MKWLSRSLLIPLFCSLVGCGVRGATPSFGGTSTAAADSDDPDLPLAEEGSSCGSRLGDAVAAAARSHASPVSRVEWRDNAMVGTPLVEARQIGQQMVALIASAKREVLVQVWQIDPDSWLGGQLVSAITSLSRDIPVYIMIEPHATDSWGLQTLTVTPQKAVAKLRQALPYRNVFIDAWKAPDLSGADAMHTKLVVVDGARALVMDANLANAYSPADAGGLGWFDLGVLVEGSIAASLREEAASAWERSAPDPMAPPFPPPRQPVDSCTRMMVISRDGGAGEDSSGDQALVALFTSAQQIVRAMTPNLNDEGAIAALAAATAHADVELILSKDFNNLGERIPGDGGDNATALSHLIAKAADPCRLHVRWFSRAAGTAIDGDGTGASHAKYSSADGQVMILGSQNLDTQSWKRSREVGVAIDDPTATGAFDGVFEQVWNRAPTAYSCGMRACAATCGDGQSCDSTTGLCAPRLASGDPCDPERAFLCPTAQCGTNWNAGRPVDPSQPTCL